MSEKTDNSCQQSDCGNKGTMAARLNVPWQGFDFDDHPVSVVMGLKMCESCFKALNPKDWLMFDHPQGMHRIFDVAQNMQARGKIGFHLDFNRAYFSRVSFNSDEWKMLHKRLSEK